MPNDRSNRGVVFAIVGPTGVGKTKLGIAIAKALQSEVISVDSLQVYRDGGIMTAKATDEEMDGVKHHLIGYLPAHKEPDDFHCSAYATIDDLHRRHLIPVLVGGSISLTIPLLFDQFRPRYRVVVFIIWLEESVLWPRLDDRVDNMIEIGLLNELQQLYKLEKQHLTKNAFDQGIWKAIGYREFYPYLSSKQRHEKLLQDGVDRMKEETKRYAKAQMSWLDLNLIPLLRDQQVPCHIFKVARSACWQEDVETPVIRICTSWQEKEQKHWALI